MRMRALASVFFVPAWQELNKRKRNIKQNRNKKLENEMQNCIIDTQEKYENA